MKAAEMVSSIELRILRAANGDYNACVFAPKAATSRSPTVWVDEGATGLPVPFRIEMPDDTEAVHVRREGLKSVVAPRLSRPQPDDVPLVDAKFRRDVSDAEREKAGPAGLPPGVEPPRASPG